MNTNDVLPLRRMTICLGLCISVAFPMAGAPAYAQKDAVGGPNIVLPTPEQQASWQARWKEIERVDHAAAVALHAGDAATAETDAREVLTLTETPYEVAQLTLNGMSDAVAQKLLAQALEDQGKDQEALEQYQQMVVNQGSSSSDDLLSYALLLLKTGQWTQALAAYNKARPELTDLAIGHGVSLPKPDVDFSPDDPQPVALAAAIHVALGLIYNHSLAWGDYSQDDKALDQYQKALALEPDWDVANFYYGRGLEKLGRSAQARAAYAKTLRIAHGRRQSRRPQSTDQTQAFCLSVQLQRCLDGVYLPIGRYTPGCLSREGFLFAINLDKENFSAFR